MFYKTIALNLLQANPPLQQQLQATRQLLPTMDLLAKELKTNHQNWMDILSKESPEINPMQIANEALEIAVEELERRLQAADSPDDSETVSLDGAMDFLRRHTPPA
jgi:hypothetical protein